MITWSYRNLIGGLSAKREACFQRFDCAAFHFAFSLSIKSLQHTLLSSSDLASTGFLPNGLFERFIGRVCGSILSTASDVPNFLERNNFIGFRDVVRLKYMFRSVSFTNILESNMIRVEVERDPEDEKDKESVMFIHDALYEMVQMIIRECYRNLYVVTVLPTDPQDFCHQPLLPLSELRSLTEGKTVSIIYHTKAGKQALSAKVNELRSKFDVWLGVPSIHPKKGEYSNKVLCV
jgi:hypothetical protein